MRSCCFTLIFTRFECKVLYNEHGCTARSEQACSGKFYISESPCGFLHLTLTPTAQPHNMVFQRPTHHNLDRSHVRSVSPRFQRSSSRQWICFGSCNGFPTALLGSIRQRWKSCCSLHHEHQNRYDDLEMDGNVSTEDKWRALHDVVLESVYMTWFH